MPDLKSKYAPLCGTGAGASGSAQPPARRQILRNRLLTSRPTARAQVRRFAGSQVRRFAGSQVRRFRVRVSIMSKTFHMG